jgi:hypothetical protein
LPAIGMNVVKEMEKAICNVTQRENENVKNKSD